MKTKTLILSICLLFVLITEKNFSQWQLLYPSVPPSAISDIVFVTKTTGFCSTVDAAIYKTTNTGITWFEVAREKREYIHSLVFEDSLHGAAILPPNYIGDTLNILETTDGGNTWKRKFIGIFNEFGRIGRENNILFSVRPNVWLMSSYQGVLRKSTNFVNWSTCLSFPIFFPSDVGEPVANITAFQKVSANKVLALANKYSYKEFYSINDSVSFILQSDSNCTVWDTLWIGSNVALFTFQFIDSLNGLAAGEFGAVMKTTDGGKNWKTIFQDSTFHIYFILHVDSQNIFLLTHLNKLLRSTDGGKSWQQQTINPSLPCRKIVFVDQSIGFMSSKTGLPFRTTDAGNTWKEYTASLEGTISEIDFVSETIGFALVSGKVYKSNDGGKSWSVANNTTDLIFSSVDMLDSINGWAASTNKFFTTTDGGQSWNENFSDPSISSIRKIEFFDKSLGIISEARKDNDAYNIVTTDGGKNWTSYTMPEPVSSYSKVQFTDYAHGWLVEQGEVWKTIDTGKTWKKIFSDLSYRFSWGFHFIDSLYGWYISDSVRFTSDGGNSWKSASLPYFDQIQDVKFISRKRGFAVGYNGSIFSTTDGGVTWNADFHRSSTLLNSISIFQKNNISHLWIGGDGFVVEYANTITNNLNLNNKNIPTEFSLSQNYPNPFNPTTTILYSVGTDAHPSQNNMHGRAFPKESFVNVPTLVTLKIYDALGREIATLVNENKEPGNYSVQWDAKKYSSGIYFYKLQSGEKFLIKKMTVVK